LPIKVQETVAVIGLLGTHFLKNSCGCGERLAQSFGKVCVYALVFFFQLNGKGEDLRLGKIVKIPHRCPEKKRLHLFLLE